MIFHNNSLQLLFVIVVLELISFFQKTFINTTMASSSPISFPGVNLVKRNFKSSNSIYESDNNFNRNNYNNNNNHFRKSNFRNLAKKIKFFEDNNNGNNNKKNNKIINLQAAATVVTMHSSEKLTYFQTMISGAVSRTIAQTIMHPANTYKTLLQLRGSTTKTLPRLTMQRLLRGADAQFLLSLPHGAFYFAVIEQVKQHISQYIPKKFDFLSDFTASTVSTTICSIISTPQMVLTDRLMGGIYPSFPIALSTIYKAEGLKGFYTGWWPALAQKIPSYGLTWVFFQEFKKRYEDLMGEKPTGQDSFFLGALAAAGATTVMNPMDTIKTRLVTQSLNAPNGYKGVVDCFYSILKDEGPKTFYRSLPPRLLSVVPMISIQFGVYEFMKSSIIRRRRQEARLAREDEIRAKKLKRKRLRSLMTAPPIPGRRLKNRNKRVEIREKFDNEKVIEEVLLAAGIDMEEVRSWHEENGLGALWNFMYINAPSLEEIEADIVLNTERTLLSTKKEVLKTIAALTTLVGTTNVNANVVNTLIGKS